MSLGDWTAWNSRHTRKRETVVEPEVIEYEPPQEIEVEESNPSATWIGRIFRWPKGTP